ncbi:magnesium transporter [Brumimicrobium aurantiacum]|uniref:Magnesium transporter MgtE n=1 Tax=Brumimicrobium aurantiacum TaxID=1737063 RepID=A0A3E1F2A5_9FLAO|nr:magnesium transporter [Brumimicrobium aurantiacum]RFC55946.1 magnesium transporter [Brumimicrobium aurantiacum]
MQFDLTKEYLDQIKVEINASNSQFIDREIIHLHPADIAEILDELTRDEAKFIYDHLDHDLQGDVLMELEDDVRQRFVESFNTKQLAQQLENLDSDDAVDILGEMQVDKQLEVISEMDSDNASELVDLLNYDENTAGGLMQTEFIRAKLDWPINRCVIELRRQAEEVDKVHTIYVVDNSDNLVGTLSLRSLLVANAKALVKDVYTNKNMAYVYTNEDSEEVARVMDKYDLVSVPVLNLQKKLVGRITIDDIVDVIREEADKDFQMASGISENVEANAGIIKMSRARLPWLLIGLLGGVLGSQVIGNFETQIGAIPSLAFFIPLVAAMGGNVGVQSSAIVVQSIANGTSQFSSILSRVKKEAILGLLNGLICGTLIFAITWLLQDIRLGISVSIALFIVIFFAAIFGTLIPLILHRYKIDPAVATGPFITTLNDVVGLFIYFAVGMMVFGL